METVKTESSDCLTKEIQTLTYFASRQAPVPQLLAYGKHFFVVDDVGRTAIAWQEDSSLSQQLKLQILFDCLHALIQLHQTGLVHGRPVLRDMTWQEGKVTFIDLEAYPVEQDLLWRKTKDVMMFLYGLCRAKVISDEEIQCLIHAYADMGYSSSLAWRIKNITKISLYLLHFVTIQTNRKNGSDCYLSFI